MSTLGTPARGKLEAVTRIAALTHRPPESLGPGSKERRSVLSNLATDLGLDVDLNAPKPALGAQIARQLSADWDQTCWSVGSTVTLEGLNRILEGAERRLLRQRESPQLELFDVGLSGTQPFVPARSKLEAVTRIAGATGAPPEDLGPGSKERRSVLVNLGQAIGLSFDSHGGKPELGAVIASRLEADWDPTCWSTGHTITLIGLNRLLLGAERWAAQQGVARGGFFFSARAEALALLNALRSNLPATWNGRECVREMREAEFSQWAQDEWAAFYFEFLGLPTLINTFGGGPRQFANTRFDYSLGHPWDLKVHMAVTGSAPLNDQVAMDLALAAGKGVGFVVLSGQVEYDSGQFRTWQREFRALHGKRAKERVSAPKYIRKSKPAFQPQMLEAFFISDADALARALASGALKPMSQGVQTSGAPRPPKYSIDLVKARMDDGLLMGQVVL
jgi:hypothetical protein